MLGLAQYPKNMKLIVYGIYILLIIDIIGYF